MDDTDDTNKVVENTTIHGSDHRSLESEHLPEVKYDCFDGYLISNDDGDDYDSEVSKEIAAFLNFPGRLVEKAVAEDNVPEFIALMESFGLDDNDDYLEPGETVKPNTRERMIYSNRILKYTCDKGALACATALLQGQTCLVVDINAEFPYGDFPLHFVASLHNYDFVKLFLSHGARTDILNNYASCRFSLPLNLALEQLNHHLFLVHWRPEDSIYKLLIILCLPQMKVALETISLLALLTKDVNEVFIDYAKKGQLIEMAALLLVANERIMALKTFHSKDIVEGRMTTWNMPDVVLRVPTYNGVKRGKLAQLGRRRSESFILTLVKLFEGAGDAIRSYLQSRPSHVPKERVVNDVASILKEASFVLKETDIDLSSIDSESCGIKEATGMLENSMTYCSSKYSLMVRTGPQIKFTKTVLGLNMEFRGEGFESVHKDIRLSNIDCESNEIKEDTVASANRDCSMLPLELKLVEPKPRKVQVEPKPRKVHVEPKPRKVQVEPMPRKIQFTQYGRPIVGGMSPEPQRCFFRAGNHYMRKFSSSEFFMRQKNQFKGETNAMWRPMQPSISSTNNVLASLAMSFKRGLRRI